MTIYRTGSNGTEVRRIQARLKERDHYFGPIDGIYGGGTRAAVRSFQRAEPELAVDGIVGPETWAALFGGEEEPVRPEIASRPLEYRVLGLTGSFETGCPLPDCFAGLTGDFDGQGISFGALQWNFGQGTLQPLLETMIQEEEERIREIFDDRFGELQAMLEASHGEQVAWARSIQDSARHRIHEPWGGYFRTLGRLEAFQRIQVEAGRRIYERALRACERFGLWSERASALMFDIQVQNGGIPGVVEERIRRSFSRIPSDLDGTELEERRLEIVANRRAEASLPRWIEDVRSRKLAIARGEGAVHGSWYDLADDYALRLRQAPDLSDGEAE